MEEFEKYCANIGTLDSLVQTYKRPASDHEAHRIAWTAAMTSLLRGGTVKEIEQEYYRLWYTSYYEVASHGVK